jgi:hypothetical protein
MKMGLNAFVMSTCDVLSFDNYLPFCKSNGPTYNFSIIFFLIRKYTETIKKLSFLMINRQ